MHLKGQLHPDYPHDVGVMLYAVGNGSMCEHQDVAFTIKVLNLKLPAKTLHGSTPTSGDAGRGICRHEHFTKQHIFFLLDAVTFRSNALRCFCWRPL